MKIDRLNIPDYSAFNDVKNNSSNEAARTDFNARLENTGTPQGSVATPLQKDLGGIAKSTDFNNSISSRVAIDQATRAIVGQLISPELRNSAGMEKMMSTLSDFAQNDPVLSAKIQRLLIKLT